jgi:hypothetical protein
MDVNVIFTRKKSKKVMEGEMFIGKLTEDFKFCNENNQKLKGEKHVWEKIIQLRY